MARGIQATLQPEDGDDARKVLDGAIQLAKRANGGMLPDSEVPDVIRIQARLGLFDEATKMAKDLEVAVQAPKPSTDVESLKFNASISFADIGAAQVKGGKKDEARASARKALEIAKTIRNPMSQPHPLSLASAIFKDTDDIPGLLAVIDAFKTAKDRQAHADISQLWLSIASIQERTEGRNAAEASLRQALSFAEEHRESTREPERIAEKPQRDPQMQAVAKVAGIHARLGDLPSAFDSVESLEDKNLKELALVELIATLAEIGETDAAMEAIDKIQAPENKQAARIQMAMSVPLNAAPGGKHLQSSPSPAK